MIDPRRYVSPDFHRLEAERLWPRVWLLAGHAGRLRVPGDYFTFELGADSILVVRDGDAVRAFHNVCPHRGTQLCDAEAGAVRTFRCPYHHWEFALDGALLAAPGADALHLAGSRPALTPVRCEVRHGFVWVRLAGTDGPSLADWLAPVDELLAAYRPAGWSLLQETTVAIPCNWKTSADAHNEGYHLRSLHPELVDVIDHDAITLELLGPHSRFVIPLGRDPAERAARQQATRAAAEAAGVDLAGLADAQLVDKHQIYVFPNVQLNFGARTLELYRHRPHPTDPQAMFFDELTFTRLAPGAAPPAPTRRRFRAGDESLGPVTDADVNLLPRLQRGLASRGQLGLRTGRLEQAIANMHRTLDELLGEW